MPKQELFRKKPLDVLSNPEQLDQVLRVIRIRNWIILTFASIIIALVLLWSFVGSISIVGEGTGITYSPQATFFSVNALVEGVVEEIPVKLHDSVKVNELIIRLSNQLLYSEYQKTKDLVHDLQDDLNLELQQQSKNASSEQKDLLNRIKIQQNILQLEKERLKHLEEHEGDFDHVNAQRIKIEQQKSLLLDLNSQYYQTKEQPAIIIDLQRAVIEAKNELDQKESLLSQLELHSPANAIVVEIDVSEGDYVRKGEPLLWVEIPYHHQVRTNIYGFVPYALSNEIVIGSEVQAAISGLDTNEYGTVQGKVVQILSHITRPFEELEKALPSSYMEHYLNRKTPLVPVIIELDYDPNRLGHYFWTRASSNPPNIHPGMITMFKITLKKKRPISYVLPFMGQ